MLASPGFTPGSGEGMAFSSIVSPSATAAMRAIWWSSAVVFSRIEDRGSGIGDRVWCGAVVFPRSSILAPRSCISVIEAVIFLGAAGQLDADLIGQADGDLPGLLQPALAHAVLSRAGIEDDARLALLNADDADSKRAGNFDLLVARQRHFAENLSAAADGGRRARGGGGGGRPGGYRGPGCSAPPPPPPGGEKGGGERGAGMADH